MKLKVISSALSLVVLCSAPIVNAESIVAGQLVANPVATVSTGEIKQKVGLQSISYIEGDTITTEADSNAKIALTSGLANVVIAPNTVMSVVDASETKFSLTQGAFSVDAQAGKVVAVETESGLYELSSNSAVNAVVTFQNGEFAAISKAGLLNVQAPNGLVTPIESGDAFVFNDKGATSVEVQAGGEEEDDEAGYFTLNNGLIVGGIVIATGLLVSTFSDGDDSDDISASPAE